MLIQKMAWGRRLTIYPFENLPVNSEMYIQADVKGNEIKIWFLGTTVRHPLRRADAGIWLEALKKLLEAAS